MPRGLSKIKQIASEAAARQKAYDEAGPGIRFFSIEDQQTAKVRFLEQGEDVWFVWTHQLPRQAGQQYGDSVLCLDQDDEGKPCPGCARNVGRSSRVVINLIWYGAPKFEREPGKDGSVGKIKKDGNNKPVVIGTEDVVAVWNASQTVGGRLAHLDEKARNTEAGGLMGNVYEIKREGVKKNTSYMIDLDTQKLPDEADRKLYESKGDPRKVIKSLSFGDLERAYSGGGIAAGNSDSGEGSTDMADKDNVFAKAASGGAINRGAFGD